MARRSYFEPWSASRSKTWEAAFANGPPPVPGDESDVRQAALDWVAKLAQAEKDADWIIPWEVPIQYNDDRFVEPSPVHERNDPSPTSDDFDDARDGRDIDQILNRESTADDWRDREYECNDTTPIDYRKGPHDDEFGVDDKDFDTSDDAPVPYENQPHDDEFGVPDDDEDYDDGFARD